MAVTVGRLLNTVEDDMLPARPGNRRSIIASRRRAT